MTEIIFTALSAVACCITVTAQVVVPAGKSWSYEFTSLPHQGQGINPYFGLPCGAATVVVSNGAPGSHGNLAFFENSLSEPPIYVDVSGNLGTLLPGIWQDFQGFIQVTAVGGEITLSQVQFSIWEAADRFGTSEYYNATIMLAPSLVCEVSTDPLGLRKATLLWSTNAIGYTLLSAPSIDGSWTGVTNAPTVIGSQFSITVDSVTAQQFFRLQKP